MPHYQLQVDELQRIRREYVVEADDAEAARELAERGESIKEFDHRLADVVERFVVPDTLVEIPQHTYEIEQYELCSMTYRVTACSEAKAIERLLEGEGEPMEGTLEFIEVAEDRGLSADKHAALAAQLRSSGILVKGGVIPSIREIRRLPPKDTACTMPPMGEEHLPGSRALPATPTYRVRYEIDVDAVDPMGAARKAYAYMVSPASYRPVLEVALHQGTGDVDFATAETFDLHELGSRDDVDDLARQLELVADIIESTYLHDAEGRRIDGDSPVSGADVVERLVELEQPIRAVLQRHADGRSLPAAPADAIRVPSLCVVLDSEPHGRETFDHYRDLEEMLEAVRRMVASSLVQSAFDGIERTVGIAIIPPADREEEA